MPNQPQDRCRHNPRTLWPTAWFTPECLPAQPPHRGNRASPLLTWVELNRLPASATIDNLNSH